MPGASPLKADHYELKVQTSPEWRFYNPSIVRLSPKEYLIAFREANLSYCYQSLTMAQQQLLTGMLPYFNSYIWFAKVGPRYYKAKTIEAKKPGINDSFAQGQGVKSNGLEDPRLFLGKKNLYLITGYVDRHHHNKLSLFTLNKQTFKQTRVVILDSFQTREKNWLIFKEEKDNKLLAVYSQEPHIIVEIDAISGKVEKKHSTPIPTELKGARGSCNPILVGDKYLAMAHFRSGFNYEHIFYTFETHAPYRVDRVSARFILDKNRKGDIEFAMAMMIVGRNMHITYGEQDCFSKVAIISLKNVKDLFG